MTLSPGICKATVRGVPDVTVFIDGAGYGTTEDYVLGHRVHEGSDIIDARPLILLDLDDPRRLQRLMRDAGLLGLADQIDAQTRPPRIEEPGRYAVVRAHGVEWAHIRDNGSFNDWISAAGTRATWAELIDPTLIRDGLS